MALGVVISPHTKTTSQFILTAISRVSLPTKSITSNPSASIRLRLSPSSRLLCCSSNLRHESMDMAEYKETFSKRMAMAGLKRHHRIALGVSGGPDSMALCVLAANWKTGGRNAVSRESGEFIDGVLAIIVDHGLRAESKDEANMVHDRVLDMGIRCEIAHCEWSDGRPKQGHLQEAARDMRYQIFHNVCLQNGIGVLLIAHHADDQEELFILRLSRNSGVLGLAGMAFTSQLFTGFPNLSSESSSNNGILLVRPLLEFSKEDMYKICQGAEQEYVEDPTNQSLLFARNRIRMSLKNMSSAIFKSELQALISACRSTRCHVDKICHDLLTRAVKITSEGCAIIDLEALNPSKVKDIYLSKFVTLVLKFISQRHRPVRGSASKLLLAYIRTFPCKTSLTAAGCYLCPAPGSKGTKIVVSSSVDSSLPLKMEFFQEQSQEQQFCSISSEIDQIVADGKLNLDQSIQNVPCLDANSSESVLNEAKRLKILSESTYTTIISLQTDEIQRFKSKTEVPSEFVPKNEIISDNSTLSIPLYPLEICYFMNRFLVTWKLKEKLYCGSCPAGHCVAAEVRHMADSDWLYLADLSKGRNLEKTESLTENVDLCSNYVKLSAGKALVSLKSIPVAARRGLPVLVNPQGVLLSIPSVGFEHCPCLTVSAVFKPRIPLGGGYSSFI